LAVTSDTFKFSAGFAARKYCHSKPGICLMAPQTSGTAWVGGMRLLKWGEDRLFGVQLKEKQYLARNWLRFAKPHTASAAEDRIAIVGI
jgi:hypothetical protein